MPKPSAAIPGPEAAAQGGQEKLTLDVLAGTGALGTAEDIGVGQLAPVPSGGGVVEREVGLDAQRLRAGLRRGAELAAHLAPAEGRPIGAQLLELMLATQSVASLSAKRSVAITALTDRKSADRLRQIRGVDDKHHLTLLCRDLGAVSAYAKVDNEAFRLIKTLSPGPYTYILPATREVPRRLQHPRRRTRGGGRHEAVAPRPHRRPAGARRDGQPQRRHVLHR